MDDVGKQDMFQAKTKRKVNKHKDKCSGIQDSYRHTKNGYILFILAMSKINNKIKVWYYSLTCACTAARCISFARRSNFFIEISSCNSFALLYNWPSRPRIWVRTKTSTESCGELKINVLMTVHTKSLH